MKKVPSIALIGAGSMGGALLKGWLAAGSIVSETSAVFDPNIDERIAAQCERSGVFVNPSEFASFDFVVLAVKPQIAPSALPSYADIFKGGAVAISVMAGLSVDTISAHLGAAEKIIRTMPNLPASIGKGATGLFAASAVTDHERKAADRLMKAAGETVWVENEEGIDLVTAVSGSGPAYFFLMTEALAEAAEALGLSPATAERLARATLTGAGALLEQESRTAGEMRKAVTSPGGTTEAALRILDGDDKALRRLMEKAAAAAGERAAALSS
ncbi:MAG: pyrroline-5-carboxylate reductase [Pseudomonadota bacterium]